MAGRRFPLARAIGIWLTLMAVESAHGVLRRLLLEPELGDLRARQVSVFSGAALIVLVLWITLNRLGPQPARRWWALGLFWLGLTLTFEVGLGRATGMSWDRIASDFDPRRGGLLSFGMLVILVAPRWIAERRRLLGRAASVAALVILVAGAAAGLPGCAPERQASVTRIRHARVFDGERMLTGLQTVVIENGLIMSVGPDASSDSPGLEFEASGRVLIPGLIDSHMHAGDGVRVLQEQLVFGVTASLGMYDDPGVARQLGNEPDDGSTFKSAAMGATVPAGHGTEYGAPVPTLSAPEEADSFVESRIREGSDFLKIIVGPPRMPMLPATSIAALVEAAHKRGRLAVAHVDRLAEARIAVRAGVDGLAHVFCDEVADDEFVRAMVERKTFVIPTLTIRQAAAPGSEWQGNPASLLQKPAINQWLTADERKALGAPFAGREDWRLNAAVNVGKLARAGVTILAGSDAPNPGTTWGASLHQELQLLVEAGLPAADVLSGATARAASRFGFADRGRIAPGLRADLVMLECDPLTDIQCTSEIFSVWKRGVPVDRERYRSSLER